MIEESKRYKGEFKRVKLKEKKKLIKKLRKNKGRDPKEYRRILNGKKKNMNIPITLNNFYDHFKQLANDGINNSAVINTDHGSDDTGSPLLLNEPISEEEVLRNIKKLKTNKSPGVDMILNGYIKCTRTMLLPIYVKLFNKVFGSGVMPTEWLVGMIVLIYKNKGDAQDVNNYRGITLLSCLGKLFTSVLNERLTEYSNTFNVINETQAGLRQEHSTLDHIFLLKCVIDLFNWRKKKLFCLFVDYKKAFDLVWPDGL